MSVGPQHHIVPAAFVTNPPILSVIYVVLSVVVVPDLVTARQKAKQKREKWQYIINKRERERETGIDSKDSNEGTCR